jgi:hypothetical protein
VFAPNHEMIGLFILKMRDDKASVVYSYFDGSHAPAIVAAVVHNTLAMDVSTLNLYDEKLVAAFSELSCPYWSTRSVSRGFLLSKALADIPAADSRLHGGDGDLAFY